MRENLVTRTPERKATFFITLPNIKIRQGFAKAIRATKVVLPSVSSPQILTMVQIAMTIQ